MTELVRATHLSVYLEATPAEQFTNKLFSGDFFQVVHVLFTSFSCPPSRPVLQWGMPIALDALGAFNGTILFEGLPTLPEKSEKTVNLRVSTNRGRAFEISVPLLSGWDYHSGNN